MLTKFASALVILLACSLAILAQRANTAPKPAAEIPIVFAVLGDGTRLEPIVQLQGGRFVAPVDGAQESSLISAFSKNYYKAGRKYPIVFGGANVGLATVRNGNADSECMRNTAQVSSTGGPFRGFVMALATSIPVTRTTSTRRKPTPEEKSEIESLVRNEYTKNRIKGILRFHNLTAIDVDNDGTAEIVGSYWVANSAKQRAVLFFIASKNSAAKYALGFTDFRIIKENEVMSKEIADVDRGVYHEMLLDTLDTDSDGIGEIFTHIKSFEGAGFMIYKRSGAKWTKAFEGSNYHCAY